jgi:hypothetical protein
MLPTPLLSEPVNQERVFIPHVHSINFGPERSASSASSPFDDCTEPCYLHPREHDCAPGKPIRWARILQLNLPMETKRHNPSLPRTCQMRREPALEL